MEQSFSLSARRSLIGHVTPACRLAGCLLIACLLAVVQSENVAFAALLLSFCAVWASSPPVKHLVKRWISVNLFILCLWLVTPFTTPGETVWQFGFLSVSREGLQLALLVTLKANALFFLFVLCVSSLSFAELARGLERLHFPRKLTMLLLFTARGIDTFFDQFRRMQEAACLRGFSPKANRATWRVYASFIALLFIRAYSQSQKAQEAMQLRGFDGNLRTLSGAGAGVWDAAFMIFAAVLAFLILYYGWLV
jgi:cobalt/nickel transport system permease protein